MASYTIYAGADDHSLYGNSMFGAAVDYYNGSSSSTQHAVGGLFDGVDNYYYESFEKFDTSSVAGTFQSASFNLVSDGTVGTCTLRLRDRTWSSPSLSNWATSSTISGLTLRGSGGVSGSGAKSISLSSIVVSASWTTLLTLQQQEGGGTGSELYFKSADNSGTTNDPYLSITTVTVQTLTPTLITNTQTFHGPTLTSAATLTPSLHTNSQTFFAPTVVADQAVAPGLFTNEQTFFAPTVLPLTSVSPDLVANDNEFFPPTVTLQWQMVEPHSDAWTTQPRDGVWTDEDPPTSTWSAA